MVSQLSKVNEQLINSIKPIGVPSLNIQNHYLRSAAEATQLIQRQMDIISRNLSANDKVLASTAINIQNNMGVFTDVWRKNVAKNQKNWQKMFISIPQASFNFDITKIQFDKIDELYSNVNIGTASLNLTDVNLQTVQNIISESTDGSVFNLNKFINMLIDLARVKPQFTMVLTFIILHMVIPYFNSVIDYVYPPESIQVFRQLRSERLQQASQQIIDKIPPNEVKQSMVVRVRELNVRSEPNIDAVVTGWIYFGCDVKVIKTDGEWIFVKWHGVDGIGIQGWVNKRYLSGIDQPSAE